jgi:hypothetical protein
MNVRVNGQLKDAVQMHGGKKWGALAALIPGRVETQRWNDEHGILPSSARPMVAAYQVSTFIQKHGFACSASWTSLHRR